MVRFSLLGLVALLLAAGALHTAPRAQANHIAGATYRGTHSQGGSVEFTVTDDGSAVTNFEARNIRGDNCTWTYIRTPPGQYGSIDDHTFERTVAWGLSLSGSFPTAVTAEGTLSARAIPDNQNPFGCTSPTLSWSATSTTAPTPTPTPTPTPAAPAPGDCTGDGGDANIVDVLRLLRHIGDPTVPIFCGSGDCTGDGGDANIVDVLRLLRHIGDPTVPLSC